MRYKMDNYEQPTRRQMRPTETEDVAVKVRVEVHLLGNDGGWGWGVRTEKGHEIFKTPRT